MRVDLRRRAAIGVAGLAVLAGCAKATESAVNGAATTLRAVQTERILAKAPGTWVCRSNQVGRVGSDTSLRVGKDRLVVTVYADQRYAYTKWAADGERMEYDGFGT